MIPFWRRRRRRNAMRNFNWVFSLQNHKWGLSFIG
jgi:hypothetical protein